MNVGTGTPCSVDEGPGVCAIEATDLNRLLEPWIEVVEVDAVLAPWLRGEWLPVRSAPANPATHVAQRLVAPDVFAGVLRMSAYLDRPKFVVGPDSVYPPADRAVAPRRLLGRRGQGEANCTAVT